MKDSTKSSRVSPSQVADRRKAKSLLVKDHKPKSSHSNAVRSKNHLAWYVALNIKQSEKKISHIPQIRWKCPPKFALNTGWHVAAGEESQEAEAQKCRESAVLEVAFTNLTAIPPCPFTSSLVEGDCHDDSQTPIIPIIPIEEMVAEMPFDTSATVNTSINPQPPASSCLSVSGDPSESQDQSIHGKSLSHRVHSLESGDLEVAAAAAATVAAAMQSKDQIDTELLIKFLSNPEMIKRLMNGNGLTSKSEDEAPPAPKAITCSPLPSSTPPASVVDKLANGHNEPVSKATVSNSTPEPVSQSLIIPCSKVETEMNKVASKLGGGPKHTPKAAKRPSHSPRFNSGGPTRKLSAFSRTNQIAREQKARPLAPPNLRPDEETIDRLVKKYGGPNFTGVKPMGSLNPSTPMLNLEAVKKMIHDYGSPDVDRVKPMAPLAAPASVPPNREEIHRTVEKYLLPDHGWGKTFMGPSPLLASSPSPPVTNLQSHVDATGIFRPSFAPMTVRAREVDLQYQKSLIKQHGEIHESGENKVPKICQSGNYLLGVKRAHNITTTEMNPKYQKPCIYFTSATGCRNGYNCLFRHDVRATGAVVAPIKPVAMAPVAKKMKLNEQFGKMAMKWH